LRRGTAQKETLPGKTKEKEKACMVVESQEETAFVEQGCHLVAVCCFGAHSAAEPPQTCRMRV